MTVDTKIGVMSHKPSKHCRQPQKLEEAQAGSSPEPLAGGRPCRLLEDTDF